ncbi:hypothetical protein NG99_03135 [Erwinia typographi]|uniref:Uncharacterized protein n=1 Tax=Erwinia typographi TaxID=371042 RepID=A0A0A3ZD27_9GAMM|nr:hypothetical protein NG99_03135 [Erwinia typographi]
MVLQQHCSDYSLNELFSGRWSGAPGEVPMAAIFVAAVVLRVSGLIRLSPMLWGLLGFCLAWCVSQGGGTDALLQHALMKSFLFALVFMLRNHFTGQLPAGYQCTHAFIYGGLCVLFRCYGPFAEGTLLSLIFAQLITGMIIIFHRHMIPVVDP